MRPKTFKFRLQSVLEFKEKIEEDEKRELARLKEIQKREEEHLNYLKSLKVHRSLELMQKSAQGILNVEELQRYHLHIEKLKEDIAQQEIKLQQIAMEVEQQRLKLLEATKEKKTYEKLKEKHYEEFLKEVEDEERKLIDELATTRYEVREKIF